MKLLAKQQAFSYYVFRLLEEARELGYEVTIGEVYRTPAQAKLNEEAGIGIGHSLHCLRLAIDINLFKDDIYLTHSEDYKMLGEWWESQSYGELVFCWGGRFMGRDPFTGKESPKPDGNHFSISHDGVK